jgi:subtilisin-like proprotein convertase family protein
MQEVVLGADEHATGIDFVLLPIVEVSYEDHPEVDIPDYNTEGVSSMITVAETGEVNAIDIDVNITHPSINNLEVKLTSPGGTTVVLHNRTGGTADDIVGNYPGTLVVDGPGALADFLGESVVGDWTLTVIDYQFGAMGTFHSWGLNLLVAPEVSPVPDDASDGVPAVTRLVGNIPNPFNPQTTVVFELQRAGAVVLDIYDVRGQRVKQLLRESLGAGRHEIRWDGRDEGGRSVASGVYFCRMTAGDVGQMHKMTLVR